MMPLPTELLVPIIQYASTETQACLARVSKAHYPIAVRLMYASIPHMDARRSAQCLRTLSENASLALLVRKYSLEGAHTITRFPKRLTRALSNMSNLTDLSLQVGDYATTSVLKQATFKLTKFVSSIARDPTYPISQFLASQSRIEELDVFCGPEDMADLPPDALPDLRQIIALPQTLCAILPHRLGHIRRIMVNGSIDNPSYIVALGDALRMAPTRPPPGALVELALGVDISGHIWMPVVIASGLSYLGESAPWISSLRLEIHEGTINKEILESSLAQTLRRFPNLKTLKVMSEPPPRSAYIHGSCDPTVSYMKAKSCYIPDPLYDRSAQLDFLSAWHRAQPSLECVVFPIGVYIVEKRGS